MPRIDVVCPCGHADTAAVAPLEQLTHTQISEQRLGRIEVYNTAAHIAIPLHMPALKVASGCIAWIVSQVPRSSAALTKMFPATVIGALSLQIGIIPVAKLVSPNRIAASVYCVSRSLKVRGDVVKEDGGESYDLMFAINLRARLDQAIEKVLVAHSETSVAKHAQHASCS